MAARVLIIDDDAQLRRVLNRVLRTGLYEVFEAEDGEAGLQKYLDHAIDLVITDVIMPNKDGLELILELVALEPPRFTVFMIESSLGNFLFLHWQVKAVVS